MTTRVPLDPSSRTALALRYQLVSARAREGVQILIYTFGLIFVALFSGIGGAITGHGTSTHAALFRVAWAAYAVAVTALFIHLLWCSALSFALWRRTFLRRTTVSWVWRSGRGSDVVGLLISLVIGVLSQV